MVRIRGLPQNHSMQCDMTLFGSSQGERLRSIGWDGFRVLSEVTFRVQRFAARWLPELRVSRRWLAEHEAAAAKGQRD